MQARRRQGVAVLNAQNISDIPALNKAGQPFVVSFANEAQCLRAEEMGDAHGRSHLVVGEDPTAFVSRSKQIMECAGRSN